jgi:cyclopropane fatty-acyl-phospholipid synthase-like methyltransferase
MTTLIPQRITAAVEMLAVQARDHLLEIGCGNGAAAALVCERLGDGRLVAIDRSEKQIRNNLVRAGFVIKAETASEQVYCLASTLPAKVALKPA